MTGENDENRSESKWWDLLQDMLNAKFETKKLKKEKEEEEDRGFFCVNCRGNSLTKSEVEKHHGGHTTLRAKKCSGFYGYMKQDIERVFKDIYDFQGIYEFSSNNYNIYFPKSRKLNENKEKSFKGNNCCAKCKHVLQSGFLYCSIECKLTCPHHILEKHLEWIKLKQNQSTKKMRRTRVGLDDDRNKTKKTKLDLENVEGLLVNVDGKKLSIEKSSERLDTIAPMNVYRKNRSKNNDSRSFRKRSRKGIPHRAPLY